MDAIMAKIWEMENHAREIVREAEQKRDQFDETIEQQKESIRKTVLQQQEARLEAERTRIMENARIEAEKDTASTRTRTETMEKFYESQREEWLKKLYDRIRNS